MTILEIEHSAAIAYLDCFASLINTAYASGEPLRRCVDLKFAFKKKAFEYLQDGSISENDFAGYLNDVMDIGF